MSIQIPERMGRGQDPVPMRRYPHMLDLDTLVWSAWLSGEHPPLIRVWYDVHVGDPIQVPPDSPPDLLAIAEGVGSKRIDVVAERPDCLWIIEVKPLGNHAALGQVIMYADLFRRRYGNGIPLQMVIVCSQADPDLHDSAEGLEILVYESHVAALAF